MAKTSWWWSYISQGQNRWQSFVHPIVMLSAMPGLMAKAVSCRGFIQIKSNSNPGRAAHEEEHIQRAVDSHAFQLMPRVGHRHQFATTPHSADERYCPGAHQLCEPPQCASMWRLGGSEREEKQPEHYEERWNWRLKREVAFYEWPAHPLQSW